MSGSNAVVIAVSGDHHTNSIVGLCPSKVQLEEGFYKASTAQMWLWRNWQDYVERVKRKRDEHNAPLISVFNGDLADGDHHNTAQIITRNRLIQTEMVYNTLKCLVDESDQNYVVKGTGAHSGKSGHRDEAFARDIEAVKAPNGNYAWWDLPLEVNGTRMNIRHHGKLGRLPWTKTNMLKRLCVETVFTCYERKEKPPHLIMQSHNHVYGDTRDEYSRIRVVALPAWQLATEFVHKIAPGALASIGGLIITCFDDGTYEVDPVLYEARKTQRVRI